MKSKIIIMISFLIWPLALHLEREASVKHGSLVLCFLRERKGDYFGRICTSRKNNMVSEPTITHSTDIRSGRHAPCNTHRNSAQHMNWTCWSIRRDNLRGGAVKYEHDDIFHSSESDGPACEWPRAKSHNVVPVSVLLGLGLHCLCPWQLLNSISCKWSWFKTSRSTV